MCSLLIDHVKHAVSVYSLHWLRCDANVDLWHHARLAGLDPDSKCNLSQALQPKHLASFPHLAGGLMIWWQTWHSWNHWSRRWNLSIQRGWLRPWSKHRPKRSRPSRVVWYQINHTTLVAADHWWKCCRGISFEQIITAFFPRCNASSMSDCKQFFKYLSFGPPPKATSLNTWTYTAWLLQENETTWEGTGERRVKHLHHM